jgi:multiple sugar transport system permease protein
MARLARMFREGDLGSSATLFPFGLLLIPGAVTLIWLVLGETLGEGSQAITFVLGILFFATAVGLGIFTIVRFLRGQELISRPMEGFGNAAVLSAGIMVAQFVLIGLGVVFTALPAMAASPDGLQPPTWLSDTRWVKPSLMLVGFWGAIGSNTMLLYLAALTNVPGELYEAADIDGAKPFQRFWNVTWPQLAPTTFFVVVMAMIGGLQGGFEMVRTMTQGGPAGSSTVLSYFIYQEGFEVGRIGFASAVAWALFLLILAITMFNWTFGNKYVND